MALRVAPTPHTPYGHCHNAPTLHTPYGHCHKAPTLHTPTDTVITFLLCIHPTDTVITLLLCIHPTDTVITLPRKYRFRISTQRVLIRELHSCVSSSKMTDIKRRRTLNIAFVIVIFLKYSYILLVLGQTFYL